MPGSPDGIIPTDATPWSANPNAADAAIARITTNNGPGSVRATTRSTSNATRHAAATPRVAALIDDTSRRNSANCGIGSFASIVSPNSFPSCPTIRTTATPWMYPVSTALEK